MGVSQVVRLHSQPHATCEPVQRRGVERIEVSGAWVGCSDTQQDASCEPAEVCVWGGGAGMRVTGGVPTLSDTP
jgi:hypothetical protein